MQLITFIKSILLGHTSLHDDMSNHSDTLLRPLAASKHALQSRLLGSANAETVGALDLDPGLGVVAVHAGQRRLPLIRALVALGRVGGAVSSPQLGTADVVGELLTAGGRPGAGTRLGMCVRKRTVLKLGFQGGDGRTYDPSVLQGDHVVNVDIAGDGMGDAGVRAPPRAAGRIAVAASGDAGAVTAEDVLAAESVNTSLRISWCLDRTYRALQVPSTVDQ